MNKLAAGDESVAIPDGGGRHDEIGDLLAAADDYRETLIRSRDLAEEASIERERLSAATENMPVGLSMYDEEKRLILCNRRYAPKCTASRRDAHKTRDATARIAQAPHRPKGIPATIRSDTSSVRCRRSAWANPIWI